MALTVSVVRRTVFGNRRVTTADITFDSTYPDNGEALTAANVGLTSIEEAIPSGPFRAADGSSAILVSYDRTNSKLLAYVSHADAQGAFPENTTADISTYSGRITFVGY